jgi:GT2 family glycosyltransferase
MMLANPMLGATELFRAIRFDERYTVNFWREETDFQITAKELGYKLACCPHAICFNYMIAGDRGGSHAAAGLRRTAWCIVNNKRFVRKHSKYLRENFNIGNEYAYLCRFAVRQTFSEVILPLGIEAKRRVLGRATAQDHGEQQAG